jgi:hypothetical protein
MNEELQSVILFMAVTNIAVGLLIVAVAICELPRGSIRMPWFPRLAWLLL